MTKLRAVLAYTSVILRQLTRDRAALFFLVVLPVAIIVIIGSVFGGADSLRVGITVRDHDPLAAQVVNELEAADGLTVVRYDDEESLRRAVRRDAIAEGVVVPDGFAAGLRSTGSAPVQHVVNSGSANWFTVRNTVQGVLDRFGTRASAAFVAAGLTGHSFDDELGAVDRISGSAAGTTVVDVGDGRVRNLSRFALVAPQELVLFVFVNSLGSAVALVIARRSGVLRRAFATRTSLSLVLVGVMLAWFTIALLESLLIVTVGAVAFGVSWGDPLAATVLVVVYATTGSGAGLLLGAAGRNEDRVGAIGPATGMVLGALGGCMVPLEVFPSSMLVVSRFTPHYWAVVAWQHLVFDGDGLGAIAGSLAVLASCSAVMVGVAALLLRRELTGGRSTTG